MIVIPDDWLLPCIVEASHGNTRISGNVSPFVKFFTTATTKLPMDMEASSMNQRRQKHKVCLVGSGNWGSVIARIAGENVLRHDTIFDAQVNMWVHEELVDGRKLTEIINETHENIKYLPGHVLPSNVVAIPELDEAAKGASVFIFCIPHQFLPPILSQLKSCAPFASSVSSGTDAPVQTSDLMCVSLMKAIEFNTQGVVLLSSKIQQELFSSPLTSGSCSVLMGANVASDVAAGHFWYVSFIFRGMRIYQRIKYSDGFIINR